MNSSTDCYESFVSGETPVMLRVEQGPHWAFPLAQILHLHHEGRLLTVTLSTHDIRVTGEHLERLLHEMAHHRVSTIRPGKSADTVAIEKIEVISASGE
jgi:hypothetical protein